MVDLATTLDQQIRPFESAMLPVTAMPIWTGGVDGPGSAVAEAKNIGAVKARVPDLRWWMFGIYQLPLWLGGSRTGKKDKPKRKAKKQARARERQEEKKGKGRGHGKGKGRAKK